MLRFNYRVEMFVLFHQILIKILGNVLVHLLEMFVIIMLWVLTQFVVVI
ncbi:hypothetical protein B879_04087 [Cecembia lonarensis LW9]|uniref:Uncharacterized protein n=1 Tax=Cecembia lonarensis (strain CCUG 58316 / KCTC 22772 / LW9) TaxID=1225176 RepID=K1L5K9_CECL9|nr:hypothetical protein B879_04087 [Cecembia lonarensis LW9]